MNCGGIKQVLVKIHSEGGAALALKVNQWLKRFERLERAFEADRARLDTVLSGSLSHDRADQVVSKDVGPNLLPH